jgi:hypothetical protein
MTPPEKVDLENISCKVAAYKIKMQKPVVL